MKSALLVVCTTMVLLAQVDPGVRPGPAGAGTPISEITASWASNANAVLDCNAETGMHLAARRGLCRGEGCDDRVIFASSLALRR